MEGIELQDGCNQQRHHPLVIPVLKIGDMVESEDVTLTGEHQQGGHQEEHITNQYHPAKTTNRHILSVITLFHLHGAKTEGTQSEHIRCSPPRQQTRPCTDDHQQATHKEDDVLYPTQLSHGLQSVWLRGHHR